MKAASHRPSSWPLASTTTTMNMKNPGRTCTGNPNSRKAGRGLHHTSLRSSKLPSTDSDRVHSTLVPYVYSFDHKHRRPPMEYKDLLGGKGANLAEMTSVLKLPVPPGFTISTDACRAYMKGGWPAGLDEEIAAQVAKLEKAMGRKLGDAADPLLVSVRSGAKFSMPGMMDTVLNLGLNDQSVKGLAAVTDDERFAYDSYRRFIVDVRPDRARRRRRALRAPARGGQDRRPA